MRGFTLMEMLLVLVLISLLFTIMMQGFGYFWQLQRRFNHVLDEQVYHGMHAHWWRSSIQGLLSVLEHSDYRFQGDREQLQGLSTFSLSGPPGVPARAAWEIETQASNSLLRYNGQKLATWPGTLFFSYTDDKGNSYDEWPPSGRYTSQLPSLIVITDGHRMLHVAAPESPQLTPQQIEVRQKGFRL